MITNAIAIIGAGFGDEGKGKVVSSLCSQASPTDTLVIRYCGGHQAGHRVAPFHGAAHIFSNFCSGALQRFDTYWSKFCTIDPVGILNELGVLNSKGITPRLYVDKECPITTPYEKYFNLIAEEINQHGTCGIGVGQTYQREADYFTLHVKDLLFPSVFKEKLKLIANRYYGEKIRSARKRYEITSEALKIPEFVKDCFCLFETGVVLPTNGFPDDESYENVIFEGSQGLLLDQDIGFFPHVTRGNVGTKNVFNIELGNGTYCSNPEIYLVTRAYQTRHGNGPMTNESLDIDMPINPHEHNSSEGRQGKFRTTVLDLDLLQYVIMSDDYIRQTNNKNLVITCLDVLDKEHMYTLTSDGEIKQFKTWEDFVNHICMHTRFERCYISRNPFIEKLERFK